MNDLEQNRIRRIENQVNAITANLIQTDRDLATLYEILSDAYDPDSADAMKIDRVRQKIERRINALNTLTPRETRL